MLQNRSSLLNKTLGALADTVRRGLPRHLQASLFGRPRELVSIEEIQSDPDCAVEWLRTDEVSKGVEPATIEDTLHWKFRTPYYRRRRHSDVWLARLDEGSIRAGRYALTPDHRLIEDVISEHAVQMGVHTDLATRRPLFNQKQYRRVALLGTPWTGSHFHWLFDVLPRMKILAESSVSVRDIPYYALPDAPHPAHREALRHLGIGDGQRIEMGPTDQIHVEDLILPSLPERRGARQVTNQDAVDAVLARHGIATVHPGEHSLGAQVALFQNADLVVGPHGAGLANIVFASPGTRVVEIFSPNYVNVCNASVASRLDLRYAYLIGEGKRPPSGVDPFHVYEDITVDVGQLDRWLRSWCG